MADDYRCNNGHNFEPSFLKDSTPVIFCTNCGEVRALELQPQYPPPAVVNNTVVHAPKEN